jgi:hypothetical protein
VLSSRQSFRLSLEKKNRNNMKWNTVAYLGLAASAYALPQAVEDNITPEGGSPEGCKSSWDGEFEITIVKQAAAKRAVEKRECGADGSLTLTLQDGILKDAQGRIGYIASNRQFQFDGPPQAGAIYTAGWSVCGDGSLALGPETTFYQCLSGNFYNLYDEDWAEQCEAVKISALPCGGASNPPPAGGSSSVVTTTIVTPLPDGQPQVITTTILIPVSQIDDGQVQAPTSVIVSQISDGQVQAPPTPVPVSEISDGQPQVPTNPPPAVSQISDGQVQAPTETAAPPPPVSQISDGQVQAPTETAAPPPPVSQISDGQVQAPTETAAPPPPVSQISDGQVQAPGQSTEHNPPPPAIITTSAFPPNYTTTAGDNGSTPTSSTEQPPATDAPAGALKMAPAAVTALIACAVAMLL